MKPHRENRSYVGDRRDLAVIVPSRGRPQNVVALIGSWIETGATAALAIGLDNDDPTRAEIGDAIIGRTDTPWLVGHAMERVGMCGTLNALAATYAQSHFAVGFLGDDHRPRTKGWQELVLDALCELGTGIVYGNDLIHGEGLPTAVFITSDIVRALGYMAPPALKHLYLDNAWLALGQALDAIRYLPDVIIEHEHPIAGKAEWDEGYIRVNSSEIQEHDRIEFERWRDRDLPIAVAQIRAMCG